MTEIHHRAFSTTYMREIRAAIVSAVAAWLAGPVSLEFRQWM
ncbi:hypothetical protein [Agrobacterium fabrum]|nr:hypothetical protein [Agrobacterium fabrum]